MPAGTLTAAQLLAARLELALSAASFAASSSMAALTRQLHAAMQISMARRERLDDATALAAWTALSLTHLRSTASDEAADRRGLRYDVQARQMHRRIVSLRERIAWHRHSAELAAAVRLLAAAPFASPLERRHALWPLAKASVHALLDTLQPGAHAQMPTTGELLFGLDAAALVLRPLEHSGHRRAQRFVAAAAAELRARGRAHWAACCGPACHTAAVADDRGCAMNYSGFQLFEQFLQCAPKSARCAY